MRRAGLTQAGFSGLALAAALLLTACAEISSDGDATDAGGLTTADPAIAALPVPQAGREDADEAADLGTDDVKKPAVRTARSEAAPHLYMELQPDSGGPISVVFAIDGSRDNTPSDDPAIRITPMDGQCNPQQLRWHEFSPEQSERPAYGPEQAARGITAQELPAFMAALVTSEMLEAGLISDPEESRPQNVCTQKLLQQMIIAESAG